MGKDAEQPQRQHGPPGSDFRVGQLRSPEDLAAITGSGSSSSRIVLKDFILAAAGGTTIPIGSPCWIGFLSDRVTIDTWHEREYAPYDTIQALQVSGSTVKTNIGVWGGGFGIIGAVEGMLAAKVVNTLTSRPRQYAVLRIVTGSAEYVFSSGSYDGSALSLTLTPVQVEIRKAQQARSASLTAPQSSPGSLADELMKLARLRDEGMAAS